MPELELAPEPFDPADLAADIDKLRTDLDELESENDAPVPRKLHDLFQDQLLKIIATMQTQIATLTFYIGAHEDRISDIEEGDGSQLLPEDAGPLIAYIMRCVEIFEALAKEKSKSYPNIEEMIAAGKEMAEFLEQITLPDDGPDRGDDSDSARH